MSCRSAANAEASRAGAAVGIAGYHVLEGRRSACEWSRSWYCGLGAPARWAGGTPLADMDGRGDTGWPATIGSPWLGTDGLLDIEWRCASMASACEVPGVGASSCAAAAAALAEAAISVAFSPAQPTTPLTTLRKPHEASTSAGRGATPRSAVSTVAAEVEVEAAAGEVEAAAGEVEAATAGSSGPPAPLLVPCASPPRFAVSVAPSPTRL